MNAISIRFGLLMLAGFIALFMLLNASGLGLRNEVGFFLGLGAIHIFCLYHAVRLCYKSHPEAIDDYGLGVKQGMATSVIGVLGFTLFVTLFLTLDPTLMDSIRKNSPIGQYLTPFMASLSVATSGLAVGMIGSYIITRVLIMDIKHEPN